MLTEQQLLLLATQRDKLPENVRERVAELLKERAKLQIPALARDNFLLFAQEMWPKGFVFGEHHKIIANAFERVANGTLKRLIIALPPRHSKSEMASYLLPAWYLGKFPEKKVIQASNTAELAVSFGRRVRNLVDSPQYQKIFPDVELAADSKAAGRWETNHMGQYFAIGVGGTMTGRGGDLIIIDDPHSENEAALAATQPEIYDKTYEWYTSGPRQRLQPNGAIIILATRWSLRDLTGQVLKSSKQRGGDNWETIILPALKEDDEPLWPQFWTKETLLATKQTLPLSKWLAQYQQNPTAEEGAIVKREWWKMWPEDEPPKIDYTIQSWDTAYLKHERADYSACTTWGVFQYRPPHITNPDSEYTETHVILLDAIKRRMEFPELKSRAYKEFLRWQPDSLIIEAKAAGSPLIQELRRMGLPLQEFTPSKGQDKISRLNSVSDMFASGRVWAMQCPWAEEVIDEVASFPSGEHDDLTDSVSCALIRIRRGGFIRMATDYEDEPYVPRRKPIYY